MRALIGRPITHSSASSSAEGPTALSRAQAGAGTCPSPLWSFQSMRWMSWSDQDPLWRQCWREHYCRDSSSGVLSWGAYPGSLRVEGSGCGVVAHGELREGSVRLLKSSAVVGGRRRSSACRRCRRRSAAVARSAKRTRSSKGRSGLQATNGRRTRASLRCGNTDASEDGQHEGLFRHRAAGTPLAWGAGGAVWASSCTHGCRARTAGAGAPPAQEPCAEPAAAAAPPPPPPARRVGPTRKQTLCL